MATFVLGLGAQKAGTTWLHRYLAEAPEFARGAMKEYHVWDCIYGTDAGDPIALEGADTGEREALRRKLVESPELYFEHFAALVEQPGKGIAADITPAYSALPAEALARICDGFRRRGINVKLIFLMRDPVERCWSAARMYRRKDLRVAGMDPGVPEDDYVRAYAASEHAQRRGRYERTVAAIETAAPASSVFYGFYESLFDPDNLSALSQFIGIDTRPDLAVREFNVSPKRDLLEREVRTAIAGAYRETLDFCAKRFPRTLDLWESYSLVS